ncbi:hypothetical protein ACIBI9_21315 [Nonomuraea sp. NPDC050451]|uniref:hypothetical protein n=1 Tax=Nonomuraea sp. NPDC050451 TaxID=3364364 RepID=UPI0037AFF887
MRRMWSDVLRVVASINTGTVRAYDVVTMLQRDGHPIALGEAPPTAGSSNPGDREAGAGSSSGVEFEAGGEGGGGAASGVVAQALANNVQAASDAAAHRPRRSRAVMVAMMWRLGPAGPGPGVITESYRRRERSSQDRHHRSTGRMCRQLRTYPSDLG